MKVEKTELRDALLIQPQVFGDKRGYFYESFNYKKLNEYIGHFDIFQINVSKSTYGVLRGLHFQEPPFTQAKLVQVMKGCVLDVIVDIRTDSPTFGQHQSFVLDERDQTHGKTATSSGAERKKARHYRSGNQSVAGSVRSR